MGTHCETRPSTVSHLQGHNQHVPVCLFCSRYYKQSQVFLCLANRRPQDLLVFNHGCCVMIVPDSQSKFSLKTRRKRVFFFFFLSLLTGASGGSYHCHPADIAYGEDNDKVTSQLLSDPLTLLPPNTKTFC